MTCLCHTHAIVKDSRPHADGVWRQRKCKVCQRVFTTLEVECVTTVVRGRPVGAKARVPSAPKLIKKAPASVVRKVVRKVALKPPRPSEKITVTERIQRMHEERELNKL